MFQHGSAGKTYSSGPSGLMESRSHVTEQRMMSGGQHSGVMGGRSSGMGGQSFGTADQSYQQRILGRESTDYFEQSKMVTKSSGDSKTKTYG